MTKQNGSRTVRYRFQFKRFLFSILFTILISLSPVYGGVQQQEELIQGRVIESELKGGESHSLPVKLTANRFFQAVIEQRGIDIAAALLGSDGKVLVEVNTEPGQQGIEIISWIAESTGEYSLQVRAFDKAAPAGRYRLEV